MAARTVSELANWDGRLDKKLQNSRWRRSSNNQARDPPESKSVEVLRHPSKLSDKRRAEHSASRSNLERGSFANPPANTRLSSRVDTTSSTSHDMHHYHRTSITHTTPNSALQSSTLIASPKSSHPTPNSLVHPARLHPRPTSSRVLSRPVSTIHSDVIDLTLDDDTEEELPLSMLVRKRTNFRNLDVDIGPSRRTLSSERSSPMDPEQSLFTPPPPRKRTRLVVDYLAVPPFPKGLTKADYRPMLDHSVDPIPSPTVTSKLGDPSLAEPSAIKWHTPQKPKGKEREVDEHPPANEPDMDPSALLDVFYEPTLIPIYDDDTYPPLTSLDLVTNTRFHFAHAWRGQVSKLQEAELDWMSMFQLLGKACIWAQSLKTPSPRMPGTTGFVSSEELRPWELALPESSSEEQGTNRVLDGQPHATGSHDVLVADADCLLLPDDTRPGPSSALNPAPSGSTASQGPALVDVEHDMHQYFNGLGDSPAKHASPRQQLAPTHTFRPHLLQSLAHAQTNSLELEFPALEPDPRLVDAGDHECFLGVPPSPLPPAIESSTVAAPAPDPPFGPANYPPASPSNILETSPTDTWSFEQEEGLLQGNDSPPNDHVTPITPGTIDPSLLGPKQSQKPSQALKESIPKRRSKLPEPVIYIRRPIDSSSLPLLSGRRAVQIKYRDSGGSPTSLSTQTRSNEASSNPVKLPKERSSNDTGGSPRPRRHSIPSRKLREHHTTSESDSDFVPEASARKIKIKIKRPSIRDKGSVVEHQGVGDVAAPTMTFCHQCRNTSTRPKMLCSNVVHDRVCGKRFCNRCILYRYPDITFDEHSAGFLCPVCTNTCNCSACSRKRGEEFISMRLGGLAASLFKAKVTFVRDGRVTSPPRTVTTRRSASTTRTPTIEPGTLPMKPQFWAHVYGMEGERMGSAFMTREQMESLQARGVSLPPLPPPLPKQPLAKARKPKKRDKEREKTKGPRVFIGRPLSSWNVHAIRDLEPSTDVENRDKGKGKEGGTGTGTSYTASDTRRRWYIGNPASLHGPYGHMPGSASLTPSLSRCSTPAPDSDGNLSPSSKLGADGWPQPDVGECCSWAPPPPPPLPGTVVRTLSSDSVDLSDSFARELPGTRPPDTVGTWPSADELQGQDLGLRLSLGSSAGSGVGVDMGIGERSASTALSQEDLARAISAALTALTASPPS